MHHAIWKLTALAVVVGVGTLVVVQAQRGFNQQQREFEEGDPQADVPVEPGDDRQANAADVPPLQSEPEPALDSPGDDERAPVPAETKIGGMRPRSVRPAPRARAVDLASQTDDEDPFAEPPLTEPSLTAPPSNKSPASRSLRKNTDIADSALELNPLDEKEPADRGPQPLMEDADSGPGPRLLTDRATREIKPVDAPPGDPFAEDVADDGEGALDVAGATEPDPATAQFGKSGKQGTDTIPSAGEEKNSPGEKAVPNEKAAPGKKIAPDDESDLPSDEMPIIERAAPRRKIASPAVPQAEDEPLELPADLLPAEDHPADSKDPGLSKDAASSSKSLSAPSEPDPSEPVENGIPPQKAEKVQEETLADPFGLDEEAEPARATPGRGPAAPPDRTRPADPEPVPKHEDDILRPVDPEPKPADGPNSDRSGELLPKAKATIPSLTIPSETATSPAADSPIKPLDEADAAMLPADQENPRAAPRKAEQPQLTIEKNAPATAVLGQPMVYHILVRNVGKVAARNVVVDEPIPDGARVDGSIPQALLQDKRLIWKLGTLEPGREKKISVRVIPRAEGTLGSVATVNFSNDAADTGTAPGPRLEVQVSAPEQAIVGTPIPFRFHVANVGPVDAGEVVIRDVLPAALRHPDGDDLEYVVGPLAAGKSRDVELTLTAAQTGKTVNRVIVTADGRVTEEASVALEVVGPTLHLERTGTRRLFPGKAGHYTNTVTNPGSAAITGVRVVETVPPGMEFVSATGNGQFDSTRRSITWTIDRLEPRESRSLRVTLNSKARGSQISVVRARDAAGGSGETVGTTQVVGVPALSIELGEIPALIETGDEIRIPVRILNRGSDLATGVRTRVILPDGMELVSVRAVVDYKAVPAGAAQDGADETRGGERSVSAGQEVRFSPIARMDSKGDTAIELTVKALRAGTARIQVEVQCDQVAEPVRREDVTTVAAVEK